MKRHLTCLSIGILLVALGGQVFAETVAGTLLSKNLTLNQLNVRMGTYTKVVKLNTSTKIERGLVGKGLMVATARDLAPGDRILAVVDNSGKASAVKASYGILSGKFVAAKGRRLEFSDGKSIYLRPEASVSLGSAKTGKIADLKSGSFLVCRLDPTTQEAWAVVVGNFATAIPAASTAYNTAAATTTLHKNVVTGIIPPEVKIISVSFAGHPDIRGGSTLTVMVKGTPGGASRAEIRGISSPTILKEVRPGKYEGDFALPRASSLRTGPVIGYLTKGSKSAVPVQASRSITLAASVPNKLPMPAIPTKVDLTPFSPPVPPAPSSAQKTVEPPKAPTKDLVITAPLGSIIVSRGLLVTGTGQPNDTVRVQIIYSNGRVGLLELTGAVVSQLAATDKEGKWAVGPISLAGPFETMGLRYDITANYPDHADMPDINVTIIGPTK